MFQQTFVPTQENHSVELPGEFYGKEVRVIAFPVTDKASGLSDDVRAFYDNIQIDFSDFKFDRDEANER